MLICPKFKFLMVSTIPPHMEETSTTARNILPFVGFDYGHIEKKKKTAKEDNFVSKDFYSTSLAGGFFMLKRTKKAPFTVYSAKGAEI